MKVIHLITRLELGGAQLNTLYTVSHLDPKRFDVVLAAGRGGYLDAEAEGLSKDAKRPFKLVFLDRLQREISPFRDLGALFELRRLFKSERPDVVHTHSSKAGILGRLAARLAGVPGIVHTYHGFGFHRLQSRRARRFFIFLERFCSRFNSETIFVSKTNMRLAKLLGLIPPGQGILIRSGIDLKRFPAALADRAKKKAELGYRMHKPLVVSVGNLKPQKNPLGFIEVARICLQEDPEITFLFIGDGELRPAVEARILLKGLHGKVFFPGWRRDISEILTAADVFVLTSFWEGLPQTLVAAMKSGLPCVCYAVDGVRDVLRDGENGFLVPVDDHARMAARVLELLNNPELAGKMGRAATDSIGPEFDRDGMVRDQESLYAQLMGSDGS